MTTVTLPLWFFSCISVGFMFVLALLIWGFKRSNTYWWAEGYWVGRHDEYTGQPIDRTAMRYMK